MHKKFNADTCWLKKFEIAYNDCVTEASRRANKEGGKEKKRASEVAAESWTAISSSNTEYRLVERRRIARVGGDFWNGMVAMGKVEEAERKTRG